MLSAGIDIEWPPRSGRRQSFPEVDRAEWFDIEFARTKMLAAQVELLDRLLAIAQEMMFRIGIISDTHGLLRPEAERGLRGVNHIIHAGDIGRAEILDALRRIAPVTAIRGNVDSGEWAREYPDTKLVRLAGKSIYVLHDLKTLKADPGAGIDVIVSGHSHVPKIDTIGGVLYLNPGSAGRRRFKLPITLATLEVTPEGMRPEIHDLGGD
jgi:putative phosphoesterase